LWFAWCGGRVGVVGSACSGGGGGGGAEAGAGGGGGVGGYLIWHVPSFPWCMFM